LAAKYEALLQPEDDTLKALVCEAYGPLNSLVVKDIPAPLAGPKQVLIDVASAAVNFPDALMVQGLYQVKPPLPFSPGAELAGTISAVGNDVRHLKAGDRVIAMVGHGGFAEQCVADSHRVMPMPPGMDFDEGAALVLTYGTSLHGLKDCGHLQPGETLVVLGAAGGVGIAAIEIGKAMGARVIAAASNDDKLDLCQKVGADDTVNYSRESLKERILELTDGRGADVIYDPVGGTYSEAAMRSLAWRGRLLVIGFAAGDIPKIPLNLALLRERSIVGVYWGDAVKHDPKGHLANMLQLQEWFATGKIKPVISERFTLDHAADAIQRVADRQAKGKIVVNPRR
jgi:NADPH2:quinone reductase